MTPTRSFFPALIASALLAVSCLTGCGAGGLLKHETIATVGVQYATLKFIEAAGDTDAQARRARALRISVEEIRQFASGDPVTIDNLAIAALGKLPATLSPADTMLATALVNAVVIELHARIAGGTLEATALVEADKVMGWVIDATKFYYVPPQARIWTKRTYYA